MFKFDPNSTANEGRWRLHDPKLFDPRSYFRRHSSTPGVSYVMGRLIGTNDTHVQAIRFDKRQFTEDQATAWWEVNKDRHRKSWTPEDWQK